MSARWNVTTLRWCASALILAAGSVLVPVGDTAAAAQPAASGGVVVIANGWSPPDVGAAAPLAGRLDAVVLYSSSDSLGAPTVAALRRLRPARVVLMGGTAALSTGVADEVRSAVSGVNLMRLSGTDRIDTAAQAALEAPAVPAGRPVVIANGWSPPDVGVAAPLADSLGGSVLFAQKNALGDATAEALRQLRPSRVVIVGGTAALDSNIEAQIDSAVPGTASQRLGGADRTDTAGRGAELADMAANSPVVIASGWSPPDVGVAAPLAAAIDGTVLFSYRSSLGEHTATALRRLAPKQVTLIGDTDAIPAAVQAEVAELLPAAMVQRIAGKDRSATAADAALYATGDTSVLVTDDDSTNGELTTSIAAGDNHTCWLQPDGSIACRGEERFGRTYPPPGTFTQISAGQTHNCGIRTDQTITCWGGQNEGLTRVNFGQVDPPTGRFTQMDAGQFHNCAVRTDQTIACWGAEDAWDYGQATAPAGRFTTVEAGWAHTCGLRTDKTVACWGAEDLPTLEGASGTPAKAPDGAFGALAAGELHTCGLRADKTIECWGDNKYDQLAAPKGKFSDLVAGLHFTCGLRTNSTVDCWGNNGNGQAEALAGMFETIEAGYYHACGKRPDEPMIDCWGSGAELTGPGQHSLSRFSKIQSSAFASCGLLALSSEIVCWGFPLKDADGKVLSDVTDGVPRGAFEDLQMAGGNAACGLRSNGKIVCWGDYHNSHTISGTYRTFDLAQRLHAAMLCGIRNDYTLSCHVEDLGPEFWFSKKRHAPAGSHKVVVVTPYYSCALRNDNSVTCWRVDANSSSGYVALEVPSGAFMSIEKTSGSVCGVTEDHRLICWSYRSLSTEFVHFDTSIDDTVSAVPRVKLGSLSCALTTDKSARCWRWKRDSSGVGYGEQFLVESQVFEDQFDKLSVGQDFACGVRVDRTLRCWGDNEYGQAEPPEGEFADIDAGASHVCGIRTDKRVICWGDRTISILLANDDSTSSGVDVLPSETPLLSVGNFHNCMVRSDRSVTCWGSGGYGLELLGANIPNESFSAVSAAGQHTCGLTSLGTITCWGSNNSGASSPPAGRFTSVEVGFHHGCGVRTNGEVACWGSNHYGQSDALAGSFAAVSAGQVHSCGLRTDGGIACWGDNRSGQSSPLAGSFLAVSAGDEYACGLRTNHRVACWGDNRHGQTRAPGGVFTAISAGSVHGCGLRPDGTIDCWGWDDSGRTEAPPGTYIAVSAGAAETCALRSDETVACWGRVKEDRPTGSR